MRRPDIPVLTTLRFPAAFAILLYHFFGHSAYPWGVLDGLSSGVSFFYVLSGFILYYNYFDLTDRGLFWAARFARVWPLHIAALLLAFCLLPFPSLDGSAYWPVTLPVNVLLLQAWIPIHIVVFSYNGVAWSLSVEAFFYLSFPWLLRTMQARGPWHLLGAAIALGIFLVAATMATLPSRAIFVCLANPLCRVFEFILGMAAGQLWTSRREKPVANTGWLGLEIAALIITICAVMGVPQITRELRIENPLTRLLGTDVIAVDFAALILIFACQRGAISRGLSSRPFEWLGEISFAIYMCHQLLIRWLFPQPLGPPQELLKQLLLLLLVTLPTSAALFHLVETPFRKSILAAYKSRKSL